MGPRRRSTPSSTTSSQAIEDEAERARRTEELRREYAEDIDILHLASELVVDAVIAAGGPARGARRAASPSTPGRRASGRRSATRSRRYEPWPTATCSGSLAGGAAGARRDDALHALARSRLRGLRRRCGAGRSTTSSAFWAAMWEYFDVGGRARRACSPAARCRARAWFPGAQLNYAERAVPRQARRPRRDRARVRARASSASGRWDELRDADRARSAPGCAALGVGRGDRVVAYLPNIPETVAAFLATACSARSGRAPRRSSARRSVIDRFAQIEPKVLLAVDGYRYGGKDFDRARGGRRDRARRSGARARSRSATSTAAAGRTASCADGRARVRAGAVRPPAVGPLLVGHDRAAEGDRPGPGRDPARAPEEGAPAPGRARRRPLLLVHDDGLDDVELPRRRCCSPARRSCSTTATRARRRSTGCGTSPSEAGMTLLRHERELHRRLHEGRRRAGRGPRPARAARRRLDRLAAARPRASAGSTSTSGATRGCSRPAAAPTCARRSSAACPTLPVYEGELQAPLARRRGRRPGTRTAEPVVGEVGELVITEPMPSMPLFFWNDPDGARYREATSRCSPASGATATGSRSPSAGPRVIYGRSDSTINRGGDPHGHERDLPRGARACREVRRRAGGRRAARREENWMPLFVVLREGAELDDDARRARSGARVREDCSPRHVPDEMRAIAEVPRTLSRQDARGAGQEDPDGRAAREGGEPRLARQPRGARLLRRDGVVVSDLAFAGLARQAELVRDGEVSSRELVELYLERIGRLDPRLGRSASCCADEALAEADAADARAVVGRRAAAQRRADRDQGRHRRRRRGDDARLARARGSPRGATPRSCARLRAAGCVILGKTHVPELEAMCATESLAFGATRNPWDPARTRGGSSGGSGTAVSAGLAAAALGTDGAGSIRIPAAAAGCSGSSRSATGCRCARAGTGCRSTGCLTRGVARHGAASATRRRGRTGSRRRAREPGRLRVARVAEGAARASSCASRSEQRAAVERSAELLRALGHDVGEREPDYGNAGVRVLARYLRRDRTTTPTAMAHPERLARKTRGLAALGAQLPAIVAVARALAAEAADRARVKRDLRPRRRRAHARCSRGGRRPSASGTTCRRRSCSTGWSTSPPFLGVLEPHGPARRVRARPGGGATASRSASSSSAAPATRRRCSRWRPSSRRTPAGPSGGRRSRHERGGAPRARGRGRARGGRRAARGLRRRARRSASKCTPTDLVSEADVATERAIRERLIAARPDDAIMGEEGDDRPGTSGLRWVVDPLDGTVNYLFGIPQWCVSIAVEAPAAASRRRPRPAARRAVDGDARAGRRRSTATPLRGGARRTISRPRSSRPASATTPRVRAIQAARGRAAAAAGARHPAARGRRARPRWLAAGRYDAYYERGVNAWDVAAGRLLCERAGLALRDAPAGAARGRGLLVAPPAMADALLAALTSD